MEQVAYFKQLADVVDKKAIPCVAEIIASHTMKNRLYPYLCLKLPVSDLHYAAVNHLNVEVYGVYPRHFKYIAQDLGMAITREIHFKQYGAQEKYNYIRPEFFWVKHESKTKLVAAITPGEDYIKHYSYMLKIFLHYCVEKCDTVLNVIRFPRIEQALTEWTNFDERFIVPNSSVIIGYTYEIEKLLYQELSMREINTYSNDYYRAITYECSNGCKVSIFSVRYSFWGNIAALLVKKMCELGAKEIIYVGKLGTLRAYHDVYNTIFSPSSFLIMDDHRIIHRIDHLPSGILERFPELSTGRHVSVPSVIEEVQTQKDLALLHGCESIDNEIAKIAWQVEDAINVGYRVSLSTLHFASDYLHSEQADKPFILFDLASARRLDVVKKKMMMLKKINQYLIEYFKH